MEAFLTPEIIGAFLTLTFLEIVLGIDNILFVSIIAAKLPEAKQQLVTRVGLLLAMLFRIAMLMGISWLIALQKPFFEVHNNIFSTAVSGQAVVLLLGGFFLLYKSTKEIFEKVEDPSSDAPTATKAELSFGQAIVQIVLIDMVFSFDSILTAVGMTNGITNAFWVIVAAVVIAVVVMMLFAHPVGKFINKHPSLQILGLSFLLLIGFMLLAEAAHLSHTKVLNTTVGSIPKGYLYFAISFSLLVEFLNMRRKKGTKT
jgi:predicted tellurium resistance membrane protein TerC